MALIRSDIEVDRQTGQPVVETNDNSDQTVTLIAVSVMLIKGNGKQERTQRIDPKMLFMSAIQSHSDTDQAVQVVEAVAQVFHSTLCLDRNRFTNRLSSNPFTIDIRHKLFTQFCSLF